jgi:phosphoenolpyruvate phosphomutase
LGIDGISLEDNRHPKVCSLYQLPSRQLEEVEAHAAKIMAAGSATDSEEQDILVFGRTEALVAGLGVGEALARSKAYADAGADAIIVQATDADPVALLEFGANWDLPVPLVAIPTTYSQVSADELARHGFGIIIYANQAIRAAAKAMRDVLARVLQQRRLAPGDPCMASIQEMIQLTDTWEERP